MYITYLTRQLGRIQIRAIAPDTNIYTQAEHGHIKVCATVMDVPGGLPLQICIDMLDLLMISNNHPDKPEDWAKAKS